MYSALMGDVQPRRGIRFLKPGASVKQPKHLRFGAVSHPKLRVLRGIPVEISRKRGTYIATFKQANEFGCGSNLSLALDDLGKTLAELYLGLTDQYEVLGTDLKNLHQTLSRYLALRKR